LYFLKDIDIDVQTYPEFFVLCSNARMFAGW